MPLLGRDPHSSAIASPQVPGSLFSLNTPFSSKGGPLSRTARVTRRDQEVANRRLCPHRSSLALLLIAAQSLPPPNAALPAWVTWNCHHSRRQSHASAHLKASARGILSSGSWPSILPGEVILPSKVSTQASPLKFLPQHGPR